MDSIYLIQHKDLPEYTKIGYTSDINQRIRQLETASPTGVLLVFSKETKDAYRIEQALHKKYAYKNSNLEWFRLTEEDIVDIITVVNQYVTKKKTK